MEIRHVSTHSCNQEDPNCIFVPLLGVPEEELWFLTAMGTRQEISLMVGGKFVIVSSFLKDIEPLVLKWHAGEE
jgi:hypothetical protein